MTQYFGKYRGTVVNNNDPYRQGRMQVSCPHVLGANALAWAMPCVPFAGRLEGFFMLPQIGSSIWVEFEHGDPDRPIWTGGFWARGQIPISVTSPTTTRSIKTLTTELTIDDALGFKLQVLPPAAPVPCTITCDATGISISIGAATIKLDPVKVSLNNGALEVI
jgi:hypothetical protein